jgi:nucleotide-binding universal stress UspA family protein
MKLKRILVATDFSPISKRAFEAGLALARATGAALKVAHFMPPVIPLYTALPLSASAELKKHE